MKPSLRIAVLLLLFLFLSANVAADGEGWKFRSDLLNSGVYDDGGIRPGNELLWQYMTEGYYGSSPAVVDGVVYICGIFDINAIDAFSGTLLWTSPSGGRSSSPAVVDGVVYTGSYEHEIHAVDASTGTLLWQYETGEIVFSSPAVAGGVVYAGSDDDHLYALDASTGTLLWTFETGGDVRSGAAVVNGTVYFGSRDNKIYALDAGTGDLLWNYARAASSSQTAYLDSSPAVVDGVVYVGNDGNSIDALDAVTGDLLWQYETGDAVYSSPAVADGVVYAGSDDDYLYALNASTGALLWSYEAGGDVRSSPAVANGIVYVGDDGGSVHALDSETGDLLWEYTSDGSRFSSPAVSEGVLYIQDNYQGYLHALATLPDYPPASVTGLHATTINGAGITWDWTDPRELGFSHVKVFLDRVLQGEVEAGTGSWTATGLLPSTEHTIAIQTVGAGGAVNATLVSDTVTTGPLSISSLDPDGVVEDDPGFTLTVTGTGFTSDSAILWNGQEQATQLLQPERVSMEVPAAYVAHSARVEITVRDRVSGESSNAVMFTVADNPDTAMARMFRSDPEIGRAHV